MSFTIRLAREGDIAALQHAERAAAEMFRGLDLISFGPEGAQVTPAPYHRQTIRDGLAFAAIVNDVPIGFAIGAKFPDSFYLAELSVDPAHGRQGIGRALVQRFIDEARTRRGRAVTLSTFRDVAWNAPFYASMGFHEIDRELHTDWMRQYERAQTDNGLDIAKRCFMRLPLATN